MTNDSPRQNAWQKPTFYAAIALLIGATVIAVIVALSVRSDDKRERERPTPKPVAAPARGIEVQPYALPPRPQVPDRLTSPARRLTYHGTVTRPGGALSGSRDGSRGGADVEPPPTVLASGEFVAAVAGDRKVFLANPSGDCALVGSAGTMTRAIDDCFAGKRPPR